MRRGKTVLTTGEVAKICSVAPRTVSKWFDQGHLKGYRIPGSKDRRIPLEQLIQFMRANSIPLNGLEVRRKRVLVMDADAQFAKSLVESLTREGECDSASARSVFEAGVLAGAMRPNLMVLDTTVENFRARDISGVIRSLADLQSMKLIGTAPNLNDQSGQALMQDGFDGYLSKPFKLDALTHILDNIEPDAAYVPQE